MEEYFGFEPGKTEEEGRYGKSSGLKQFKKKFPKNQEEKIAVRKETRKKKQEKKGRLIVRNLSFKVDEEELKKAFAKYGDIVDINIPKKPDGKMRGFAFVQYKTFRNAIEAVRNLNYQKLKGRPIAVDYALAKDRYQHITSSKHTSQQSGTSKEPKDDTEKMSEESDSEEEKTNSDDDADSKSEVGGKSEEESVSDKANDHVKKFLKEFDADKESLDGDGDESEEDCSESESSSESDDDSTDFKRQQNPTEEDEDSDSGTETDTLRKRKASEVNGQEPLSKKKKYPHDIDEGKTIFIRNVSFDTEQDALKKVMETFGPIKYSLLVIDKFTELPKGTAFVKFENKEDADKVIQKSSESDPEGIYLDGRKLCCSLAISREKLQSMRESSAKVRKDKRNLCLLKVGLIKKDSEEAEGVSQSDLTKRAKLEIAKRNRLKNLQFFVSDNRLCVHNIPSYYSDAQLRKLFKNAATPGAKITEARIMRNFKKVNAEGVAASKGFGFVAFEKHEDALKALKAINNNPGVFTAQQRPIVEFSVENMNALQMKQRRKEKSVLKNKKASENPEANCTEEENLTLKFNKSNADKKNMQGRTWKRGHAKSNNNNWQKKSKLENNKMGNKSNKGKKPPVSMKKQQADNRPVKENAEKKKNKKQKKKKNKNGSLSEGSGNFTQMVDKYKQKLLSSM